MQQKHSLHLINALWTVQVIWARSISSNGQKAIDDVLAFFLDFIWKLVLCLILRVQELLRDEVQEEATKVKAAVDEAGDNTPSLRIVLPETLQTEHKVYATSKGKQEVENISFVIVIRREGRHVAAELDYHGYQKEALDVHMHLVEEQGANHHAHQDQEVNKHRTSVVTPVFELFALVPEVRVQVTIKVSYYKRTS